MENSSSHLRRQARLLKALLDQAEDAAEDENWRAAEDALATLGDRLQQRLQLAEGSALPWTDQHFLQHATLVETLGHALVAAHRQDGSPLRRLRTLLDAHLRDEDPCFENAH